MLLSDDVWKTAGSLHSQKRKTLIASKTSHTTLCKLSHNAFPNPNIRDTTVGGLHCVLTREGIPYFHIIKLKYWHPRQIIPPYMLETSSLLFSQRCWFSFFINCCNWNTGWYQEPITAPGDIEHVSLKNWKTETVIEFWEKLEINSPTPLTKQNHKLGTLLPSVIIPFD